MEVSWASGGAGLNAVWLLRPPGMVAGGQCPVAGWEDSTLASLPTRWQGLRDLRRFLKLFERVYAPWQPVCWRRSAEIALCQTRDAARSIVSTSASAMIWIRCCTPSAAKSNST